MYSPKIVNPQTKDEVAREIEQPDRESAAGYHFVSAYIENPYGWYLRYVRGLRPRYTKPALVMGGALHKACEYSYRNETTLDDVVYAYQTIMVHRKPEYASLEDWETDFADGTEMLVFWYNKWHDYDWATYNFLVVEEKFSIALPNGYFLTVKPDLVVEHKIERNVMGLDHKSTRRSMPVAHAYLEGSDQATGYLWAIRQLMPKRQVVGIQSDVLYKNRSKIDAQRVGIITRSDRELAEFQLNMIGALSEIAQKVKALADGWPAALLFPRNGKDESFFGGDWPHIYRAALPEDPTEAPFGYEVDSWTINYTEKIVSTINDNPTPYAMEDTE